MYADQSLGLPASYGAQKRQRVLGYVQIRIRYKRWDLNYGCLQKVRLEVARIVDDDLVDQIEGVQLEGAVVLTQECAQCGQHVVQDGCQIYAQGRSCDQGQRLHAAQTGYFVL